MSKPTLYLFSMPTFNSSKALLAAEESGVDYDVVLLDPGTAEHKSDAHRARHPLGKVPALTNGDFQLFESLAIARYFDDLAGGPLSAPTAEGRARINQWADFVVNHIGRAVGTLYLEEFLKPTFRGAEPDKDLVAGAVAQLERELGLVDAALAESTYVAGEHYSLADVVLLAYVAHEEKLSIDLAPLPNLTRWYRESLARPQSAEAFARYGGA